MQLNDNTTLEIVMKILKIKHQGVACDSCSAIWMLNFKTNETYVSVLRIILTSSIKIASNDSASSKRLDEK